MQRAAWAVVFLLFTAGETCRAQEVRVGILSRYHPRAMELRASQTEAVVVRIADRNLVLVPDTARDKAEIAVASGELLVTFDGREYRARELQAAGRAGAAEFTLAIPGQVSRRYQGKLAISVREDELAAMVTMPLETAVASVVQAESTPGASAEALAALAVVARSYFVAAKARHRDFDFCDLTHCQVLRSPPLLGSPAARAARETRGLVLAYREQQFAAMFTRSCSGRTRTPAQDGMTENVYPYFAVICDYCHSHPSRWTRSVSREDGALLAAKGEAGRLAVDRRLGWNAVPSNSFETREEGNSVILEGSGQGHGIGLCQRGAEAMAAGGASFRDILRHYFPNTTLRTLPEPPGS